MSKAKQIESIQKTSALLLIEETFCDGVDEPQKLAKTILKKAIEGGEINDENYQDWIESRLIPNSVFITSEEYSKMCIHALKILLTTGAIDFGGNKQRGLWQMWADMTRGYIGEYAVVKFLQKHWQIEAELGQEKGNIKEYLPTDIHNIKKPNEKILRKPQLNIGIKTTKWNGIWLDIPGQQFTHSDIHILVKVGAGRDHLFSFFKEISVFKDKVLKKGIDVGSINSEEADELYESLPSFTNIPAYICGFVIKNKSYPTLSYGGKVGRNIFTVTSWNGFYNRDQDFKELIEIEKNKKSGINKAKFQGIGDFAHSGYVFNTGNLLWTKQDWDSIINKL